MHFKYKTSVMHNTDNYSKVLDALSIISLLLHWHSTYFASVSRSSFLAFQFVRFVPL